MRTLAGRFVCEFCRSDHVERYACTALLSFARDALDRLAAANGSEAEHAGAPSASGDESGMDLGGLR